MALLVQIVTPILSLIIILTLYSVIFQIDGVKDLVGTNYINFGGITKARPA